MDANRWKVIREVPTAGGLEAVGSVLLLAVGSGMVVFAGLGLLALAGRWPVKMALAGSGFVVLAVWSVTVLRSWRLLMAREVIETMATTPAEATTPATVTLEVADLDSRRMSFLDVPCSPDALAELARGLELGRPFSEAEWTGAGRPFSKRDFRLLRSRLLEARLLEWRHPDYPAQGLQLSGIGRAVFGRLADHARAHAHASGGDGSRLLPGGG